MKVHTAGYFSIFTKIKVCTKLQYFLHQSSVRIASSLSWRVVHHKYTTDNMGLTSYKIYLGSRTMYWNILYRENKCKQIIAWVHCVKSNRNLCIKTEPVTAGACRCKSIFQMHLLQPWQARFLCRDSDYFRDSVASCQRIFKMLKPVCDQYRTNFAACMTQFSYATWLFT